MQQKFVLNSTSSSICNFEINLIDNIDCDKPSSALILSTTQYIKLNHVQQNYTE